MARCCVKCVRSVHLSKCEIVKMVNEETRRAGKCHAHTYTSSKWSGADGVMVTKLTHKTPSAQSFLVYIYSIQSFFCCCCYCIHPSFFISLPRSIHIIRVKFENNQRNSTETKCLSDRKWVFRHYFPFWDLNQSSRPIQLNIFFSLFIHFRFVKNLG